MGYPDAEIVGLVYRTYETLTDELGASFVDAFIGAEQVGEEWFVFIDGDLDGKNNENTLRYIRSWNRARIQLVNTADLQDREGRDAAQQRLTQGGMAPEAARTCIYEISNRLRDVQQREGYRQHLTQLLGKMGKSPIK